MRALVRGSGLDTSPPPLQGGTVDNELQVMGGVSPAPRKETLLQGGGVEIEESLVSCAYPVPLCPRHLRQRSSLAPEQWGSEQALPSCSFWPSEELPVLHQPREKGDSKLGKS